jgi:hypothetical protein
MTPRKSRYSATLPVPRRRLTPELAIRPAGPPRKSQPFADWLKGGPPLKAA